MCGNGLKLGVGNIRFIMNVPTYPWGCREYQTYVYIPALVVGNFRYMNISLPKLVVGLGYSIVMEM